MIQRLDTRIHLEPKAMDLLCHLSEHSGQVISAEQILKHCWPRRHSSDSVVYKNIAILRRALGERNGGTKYIMTIPKRGYRLYAKVAPISHLNAPEHISDKDNLERGLRILNRLTLKQIQNEESLTFDPNVLRTNSRRLLKISKRLLDYVTGIPKFEESD